MKRGQELEEQKLEEKEEKEEFESLHYNRISAILCIEDERETSSLGKKTDWVTT